MSPSSFVMLPSNQAFGSFHHLEHISERGMGRSFWRFAVGENFPAEHFHVVASADLDQCYR